MARPASPPPPDPAPAPGSPEAIAQDIAALRADVAALAASLRAFGATRTEAARDSAETLSAEALDRARATLADLRRQIEGAEGAAEARVAAHPLQALMVAFGLGFLASLALRR